MNKPSLDLNGKQLLLRGAVTIATTPALFRQVPGILATSALPDRIVVDCSQIEEADSAAIGLLVEIHHQLTAQGKSMVLSGLREQLVSLIKIYGVEWILAESEKQVAS